MSGLGLAPACLGSHGFTPLDITAPALALWVEGDGNGANGTAVSTWRDLSGSGHSPTASGAARPSVVKADINGRDALAFDGVANVMQSTFALALPITVFVALKTASPGASGTNDIVFDGAAFLTSVLVVDSTPEYYMYSGTPLPATPQAGNPAATYAIMAFVFAGAGTSQLQRNGTIVATGSAGNRGAPGGITIGAAANSSRFAPSHVAEMIVYAGAMTTTQINQVNSYLGSKYGIAIHLN